jgi:hypothetical protein
MISRRREERLAWALALSALLSVALIGVWSLGRSPFKAGRLVAAEPVVTRHSQSAHGGATSKTEQEFELVNDGDAPVRITAVETGCAAMTAFAKPTLVESGGKATIFASGTPLSAGLITMSIAVHTDSALTPVLHLKLRMINDRPAPFVHAARGDFAYVGEVPTAEPCELIVTTLEAGPRDRTPIVEVDLPFLKASPTGDVVERNYDETSIKEREYRFLVSFTGDPPPSSFSGSLRVVDPWSKAEAKRFLVHHRSAPRVQAIPASLTLTVRSPEDRPSAGVGVLIKAEVPELIVEPDPGGRELIAVREVPGSGSRSFRKFVVSSLSGATQPSQSTSVIIRTGPDDPNPVVVPVVIRGSSP